MLLELRSGDSTRVTSAAASGEAGDHSKRQETSARTPPGGEEGKQRWAGSWIEYGTPSRAGGGADGGGSMKEETEASESGVAGRDAWKEGPTRMRTPEVRGSSLEGQSGRRSPSDTKGESEESDGEPNVRMAVAALCSE